MAYHGGEPEQPTDIKSWIGMSVMVADALTKYTQTVFRRNVPDKNMWEFAQSEFAEAIKAHKQASCRRIVGAEAATD
eukprot:7188882-Prorocentrum_lima.AAC.1